MTSVPTNQSNCPNDGYCQSRQGDDPRSRLPKGPAKPCHISEVRGRRDEYVTEENRESYRQYIATRCALILSLHPFQYAEEVVLLYRERLRDSGMCEAGC